MRLPATSCTSKDFITSYSTHAGQDLFAALPLMPGALYSSPYRNRVTNGDSSGLLWFRALSESEVDKPFQSPSCFSFSAAGCKPFYPADP